MTVKIKTAAVYCGSSEPLQQIYTEAAAELGRFLADNKITLVFGGSNCGTMKTLADSVIAANGKVIGVFPAELSQELLHKNLDKVYFSSDLAERKNKMFELADILIALPGSIGTWDELFDALAVCKISGGKVSKTVIALNINGFYEPLKQLLKNSETAGFSSAETAAMLNFVDKVEDLSKIL